MVYTNPVHADSHTDGSDDIQDGTSSQKGLVTTMQVTKLDDLVPLDTLNSRESINLARSIFDKCTDSSLIMIADGVPGGELITNGHDWTGATGATPPTGWLISSTGIFTIESDGGPSGTGDDNLKIAVNATPVTNPKIYQSFTTVIGKQYTIGLWFKKGTANDGYFKLGTSIAGAQYTEFNLNNAAWTYHQYTFIATTTTSIVTLYTLSAITGQDSEFDNITCTLTSQDYSGKGHNGTFSGAMTAADRVYEGNCFVYDPDGTDDYINFGDDDDFSFDDSGAAPFTIGVLVEVSLSTAIQTIISKWDSGSTLREWKLYLTALEEARMSLYDESADTEPFVESAVLSTGKHFIVVTYDGSGGNDADDGLNMYIDGVLDNTDKSSTVGYTAMEPSITALTVGGSLNSGAVAEPMQGDIGAILLNTAVWSAADVWSLWLEVKSKYGL